MADAALAGRAAAERGALHVEDRVFARIAERAALGLPAVVRHAEGLNRVSGRGLPRVDVTVAGGRARVRMAIAVAWPQPLVETAAAVRDEVAARLHQLTGVTVDAVDVSATCVIAADPDPGRRVQ